MNIEASNALLKTLEEPPEKSMIILISSNPSKLLPTILSRVKKIRFKPLKKEEITLILTQKGVDEEKAKKLASLSEGSLEIPMAVLNKEVLYNFAKDFYNLLVNTSLHPEGIITLAENIEKLEIKEINLILDIISIMLEKSLLKGKVKLSMYEKFINELPTAKIGLEKGVKKKLIIEGLYFNLKT
jgi:DNA polymerase-3 subunit delta'